MGTTTFMEAVWTVAGLLGLWSAWLLWRRAARQVHVAEAWRDGATGTPERADAEAALLVSRDRRERNVGLVIVQAIFLAVGLGVALQTSETTPEWFRTASQVGLVAAQIVLVATAWRSVRAGDKALRLLMRRKDAP